MILYVDASALVKLYVAEVYSAEVAELVRASTGLCMSLVGYAEVRSALARRRREHALDGSAYELALGRFEADWSQLGQVAMDEDLVRMAGALSARHALRGFDAVHLASAMQAQSDLGAPIAFLTFDGRLNNGARAEGLTLPLD